MSRWGRIPAVLGVAFGLALAGCVIYEKTPGVYSAVPSNMFDRSWSAALGAFADAGVLVEHQDPSLGAVRGRLGDTVVMADIRRLADGRVQVEFGVSGNVVANSALKERVVDSYNRRMGR